MASQVLLAQGLPRGGPHRQTCDVVHPDDLRRAFAVDMSRMYREEVPLYGDLIRIVQSVNKQAFASSVNPDTLERLTLERHGAIRLGTPSELRTVSRIFAVLGMQPVGYYDLSAAGLPMHATCFRPVQVSSLATNPFRVFTTLLRPQLIRSQEARSLAKRMLSKRNIFSAELIQMLSTAEEQGGLDPEQAGIFIHEALKTFSWAPVAAATAKEYELLKAQHPILADIACFKIAHINHLTPRKLNITLAQAPMLEEGLRVKDRIEGPPRRRWPILLRQTSFLALEEAIKFIRDGEGDEKQDLIQGSHKARFGEIEECGAAVTPAGRALYDKLLAIAMEKSAGQDSSAADAITESVFQEFPDDWAQLRARGLVYCEYECTGKAVPDTMAVDLDLDLADRSAVVEALLAQGVLETKPITYEDFLPFSAAGIFQSNLGGKSTQNDLPILSGSSDQHGLAAAMGRSILDSDELYAAAEQGSLNSCLQKLAAGYKA
ncbi:uncharacterized protein F5Z01DRAFT_628720 [Emericellopsis atlantica]|uniref:2-oxoadipate dioxygenase/decarboxylase n=1 Tax=Emericellopsis atlantica TaxID=2614577 RepID=A0A9P8CKX8_9HYPO|nr:uncharacterized protein F5Z01DRAFT_628720 [Emericellopsis atlantica]KAG9250813.1 hypothetical protein F5Z01DRAFT_628720 [Emericellopsis atlantica]